MPTLEEIEAILIDDDSRSRAGHIIQVRRESDDTIRLVAVPFVPVPSNVNFVSYVIFTGPGGRLVMVRSVNWFFVLAFGLMLLVFTGISISGESSGGSELPWILTASSVYLAQIDRNTESCIVRQRCSSALRTVVRTRTCNLFARLPESNRESSSKRAP